MKILAIETSCDETAVAILEASGDETQASFSVLGNALISQIELHREFGGVFPALAKREHAKNLVPLLEQALREGELYVEGVTAVPEGIDALLTREQDLFTALKELSSRMQVPEIDAIAVTHGPGLEPALWVGVNTARALAQLWNKPLLGINHMEGHMISALARVTDTHIEIENTELPLLALLISGGHTELVAMDTWLSYELIGQTLDDAVGEAFDKVARMLDLPYPGGPEVSRLAERARARGGESTLTLPRPMLHDPHCDFSFSGLKTAVMYYIKNRAELLDVDKEDIAREFEDAATEVLWKKTVRALEQTNAKTLVLGGGVSANIHIRREFEKGIRESFPHVTLRIPEAVLTTDNAIMIALAGYFRSKSGVYQDPETLTANGNLTLTA